MVLDDLIKIWELLLADLNLRRGIAVSQDVAEKTLAMLRRLERARDAVEGKKE